MNLKETPARLAWALRHVSQATLCMAAMVIVAMSAAGVVRWHLAEREAGMLQTTRAGLLAQAKHAAEKRSVFQQAGPAQELTGLRAALSDTPVEATVETLARLQDAAQGQGLVLQQGSYRTLAESDASFAHVEFVMSAKGNYLQLRRFALQALVQVPSLALVGARFSRPAIGDASVDVEFRFWLFVRRAA